MREILAFLRRDALVAASYRTAMIFSLGSLVTVIIPLFFIAGALQPVLGPVIDTEGGQYFAFLVAGLATYQFVSTAVASIPTALASGFRTGTFEALLATPARLPTLLLGMMAYPFTWTTVRAIVLLGAGSALGAGFELDRLLVAVVIWAMVTAAYIPFGILASALLLVTRTTGPLPNVVLMASMFLGGVYYPTSVIPSWLRDLSEVVPLTYGLRALRRVLTEDRIPPTVASDLLMLAALALILLLASVVALQLAMGHARRAGTLAQY